MSKFWFNEKVLVLFSILLLLLFGGFIALFGSLMRIILVEPVVVDCPAPEIGLKDRGLLEDQIVTLYQALEDIPREDVPREEAARDTCLFVPDGDGPECLLTIYDINVALGLANYRLGHYQKAKDYLNMALAEKEDAFVYVLLADNEWQSCRYRSAQGYLLKALELDPEDYHHWQKLIRLEKDHLRAGFERLSFLYSQAVKGAGGEVAFSGYAHFLESYGHYLEAANLWRDFLNDNPGHRDIQARIDRLESKIK